MSGTENRIYSWGEGSLIQKVEVDTTSGYSHAVIWPAENAGDSSLSSVADSLRKNGFQIYPQWREGQYVLHAEASKPALAVINAVESSGVVTTTGRKEQITSTPEDIGFVDWVVKGMKENALLISGILSMVGNVAGVVEIVKNNSGKDGDSGKMLSGLSKMGFYSVASGMLIAFGKRGADRQFKDFIGRLEEHMAYAHPELTPELQQTANEIGLPRDVGEKVLSFMYRYPAEIVKASLIFGAASGVQEGLSNKGEKEITLPGGGKAYEKVTKPRDYYRAGAGLAALAACVIGIVVPQHSEEEVKRNEQDQQKKKGFVNTITHIPPLAVGAGLNLANNALMLASMIDVYGKKKAASAAGSPERKEADFALYNGLVSTALYVVSNIAMGFADKTSAQKSKIPLEQLKAVSLHMISRLPEETRNEMIDIAVAEIAKEMHGADTKALRQEMLATIQSDKTAPNPWVARMAAPPSQVATGVSL